MDAIINSFDPIGLDEMSSVKLMNRVDMKFVTTMPRLLKLLQMAQHEYFIQEIDDKRASAYTTLYYDTPVFERKHTLEVVRDKLSGGVKLQRREVLAADACDAEILHNQCIGADPVQRGNGTDRVFKLAFVEKRVERDVDAARRRLRTGVGNQIS